MARWVLAYLALYVMEMIALIIDNAMAMRNYASHVLTILPNCSIINSRVYLIKLWNSFVTVRFIYIWNMFGLTAKQHDYIRASNLTSIWRHIRRFLRGRPPWPLSSRIGIAVRFVAHHHNNKFPCFSNYVTGMWRKNSPLSENEILLHSSLSIIFSRLYIYGLTITFNPLVVSF